MDGINKEKWKALSKKQKAQFVWDYYRWHIIIAILVLAVGGSMLYDRIHYRAPLMSVIMVNNTSSLEKPGNADFSEFLNSYGYENYDSAVSVNTNMYIYTEEESPGLHDDYFYSHTEALIGMLFAGGADVVFGWGDYYENDLVNGRAFADLREVLPAEVLEAYADDLLYCNPVPPEGVDEIEGFEPYPCAILLDNNAWIKGSGYYNRCYLALPKRASGVKEITIDFVHYLLQQED